MAWRPLLAVVVGGVVVIVDAVFVFVFVVVIALVVQVVFVVVLVALFLGLFVNAETHGFGGMRCAEAVSQSARAWPGLRPGKVWWRRRPQSGIHRVGFGVRRKRSV